METNPAQQSIGYWLNRCNRALTGAMNRRLAAFGVSRLDWQLLNVLGQQGPLPEAELMSLLRANAAEATLQVAIANLTERQLLRRLTDEPAGLTLTEAGLGCWHTLSGQIKAFREESMTGITADEYQTALSVLQRLSERAEQMARPPDESA